ncbi:hypothetical protein FPV67DRAFT_1031653 [Lyophyllum atratum]|nr:hypothetical protein FPV67DRAFT_1031653 [Lyophyllum atratum]
MVDNVLNPRVDKNIQTPIARRDSHYRGTRRVNEHGLTFSPLSFLPIDIWEQIFLQCLPQFKPIDTYPINYTKRCKDGIAPLLLCCVCSSWRKLAISMPHLWCSLDVVVSCGAAFPHLELVSLWLSRSGSLPISITLSQANESYKNLQTVTMVLDLFKAHVYRWQRIQFDLAGPRPQGLLGSSNGRAPLLEQFYMRTYKDSVTTEVDDLQILENDVPRLSTLAVSSLPPLDFWSDPETCMILWNQLKYISVDFVPSLHEALSVLSECHSLEHCALGIDGQSYSVKPPVQITHNTLRVLKLDIESEALAMFLDTTVLPALENLTISGKGTEVDFWPHTQLEEHLKRSSARLRVVHIRSPWTWDSEFAVFFRHPALQDLIELNVEDELDWVSTPCFTMGVIEMLRGSKHIPCILPTLETLEVRGYMPGVDAAALLDMVESRWRRFTESGAVRLRIAHLLCPGSLAITEKDLRKIQQLKQEGLELEIR